MGAAIETDTKTGTAGTTADRAGAGSRQRAVQRLPDRPHRPPAARAGGSASSANDTSSTNDTRLATALGWFSIGLGLAELVAPAEVSRLIGMRSNGEDHTVMRALGVRELTAGVGILTNRQSPRWLWSRAVGDAMDLALLGRVMSTPGANRSRATAATAAVLGVTALDVMCAKQLARDAGASQTRPAKDRGIHVLRSITVNRTPEDVYSFWRDFANLPRFMRHLESVTVMDSRRSHWKARAAAGATVEWDAEVTEDDPNRLIAWRSLPGADVDNHGRVRFRAAPGNRGTELEVDIHYAPPGGAVGAKLASLFHAEPGQQVRDDLRTFKQVLETGELLLSDATVHRGPHPAQPEGRTS